VKKKFLLFYIICLPLFLASACTQGVQSANNSLQSATSDDKKRMKYESGEKEENTLLRADPRFISWLEKESLYRHAPELIRIVTGTSLAWRAPSSTPQKTNILASSPAWFYANPWQMQKGNKRTHFGEFLYSKSPQLLKDRGIGALYFSPTSSHSLDNPLPLSQQNSPYSLDYPNNSTQLNATNLQNIEYAASYKLAKDVGSIKEYQKLEQIPMLMGGDILEPALSIGPDFLLALRAVREYPGLFIMTELPQELWDKFPSSQEQGIDNTTFSPQILNRNEKEMLAKNGIIPPFFARDFLPDANKHGFALTNPIRGVDSAKRRWIYRYAQSPYRPLLNMADPNFSTHELFAASIIQQIGILHQPLIGISIADLWGQESFYADQEQDLTSLASAKFASTQFAEPALFTLRLWNKTIHNYGSWSLVRDAFPLEYIPLLLGEGSDFVADTIFMPALEKSFLAGNATALKTTVQDAMKLNITFSSLWHGSADTYRKIFLEDFFIMPTSMSLASRVANISEQEAKIIQKAIILPYALEENQQLSTKYNHAKKIQFAHLAFPALLPGLNFISGHDIRGTIPHNVLMKDILVKNSSAAQALEENNTTSHGQKIANLPNYSLTKNKGQSGIIQTGIMLNPSLNSQHADKNSLLAKLQKVYEYRQEKRLGEAKLLALLDTQEEIFGVLLQSPTNKYYLTIINTSEKNIRSKVTIPFAQKNFTRAKDSIKPLTLSLSNNRFSLYLRAWEVKCFELNF